MSKTIHIKKLQTTPQELHREFGIDPKAKCAGCGGGRPVVWAIVLAPLKEARDRGMIPLNMPQEALVNLVVPIQQSAFHKPEPFVRLSKTFSCQACRKVFEKELAKAPSWCIVEIQEGPNPTNRVVVGAS